MNYSDLSGHSPKSITNVASIVGGSISTVVRHAKKSLSILSASAHEQNRRPYNGEPGSTYYAPNGDRRRYGPDGTPEQDYDHDDHGNPNQHPHDEEGGHYHDWEKGRRGPAHAITRRMIGGTLLLASTIALIVIAADDITYVGVADDFLVIPLEEGVRNGLIMLAG